MNTRASATALRHRLARRRGTKILRAAAGAAALTATIMGSPAGAVSNVTGTGSPACNSAWTGTINFFPALHTGGNATSVNMALTASFDCAGGTPTPVPPPSSGSYFPKSNLSVTDANNCAKWFAAYPGFHVVHFTDPLDGPLDWAPAGINPSNVSFPAVEIRTGPAGRLTVTLPAPSPAFGHVTGSYAPKAQLTLRTNSTLTSAQTACNWANGLSSLTVVASNPGGSSTGTF